MNSYQWEETLLSFFKKIISLCLSVVVLSSVFVTGASALSENARYYESIPDTVYATAGEKFKFYYNNILSLPGLKIAFDVPDGLKKYYYEDRIEILSDVPGDYVIPWRVYDDEYVLVDSGEVTFVARDINLKNMTGLVLGDSTVNAGVTTQLLLDIFEENGKTLTLLGTRGTAPNLHEGRGGWSAGVYCNSEKSGGYTNPFFDDGFNFTSYMDKQNYNELDFVIIQLGINDIKKMTLENYSSKNVLKNFDKIISSIREYDEKIPVIVGVTIPPSEVISDFNAGYASATEFEYRNNVIHFASDLLYYFEGSENIYFSPNNCVLNTNGELKDLIHPTDEGYVVIAKQYISTINCILNQEIVVKAPVITSATVSDGYVTVNWNGTFGAENYIVTRNGKKIAETTSVNFRDETVESGQRYYYKIKAQCANGSEYLSQSYTVDYISTPELVSAVNTQNGVKVTWKSVAAAQEYFVYRKLSGGKWSKVGTTDSTNFTDKSAKSGYKYLYTVRACSDNAKSGYDVYGVSTYYISAPAVSVSNKLNSTQLKWSSVKGAKGYYVYRKQAKNGKWERIAKISSTSYTDKNVKSGGSYYYTVRGYNGASSGAYLINGVATKYLSIPTLNSAVSRANGVIVSYNKVAGATGYVIYRKTGNSSWKKLATVNGNNTLKYVDATAEKGKTYTYTVRARSGKYLSSYNTKGVSVKDVY